MREPSGRFVLRVPPELHRRLRERASREACSLNALCVRLLDAALGATEGDRRQARAAAASDLPVPSALVLAVEEAWRESLVGLAAFGSTVRGEAAHGSDVDLLIVLERGSPIERGLYERWSVLVGKLRTPEADRVSPQFVALPASPEAAGGLWLEAAREARVLLDRQGRLTGFLTSLRDLMMSGAVARRTAHGQPYWVRRGNSS